MIRRLINDLIDNKDLIFHLTMAEFKKSTARTYLGILWWIIDPILYMAIFYFLVEIILQRGGPGYAIYLFTGLIPLKWVTASLVSGTNAISSNGGIIRQVYVPKVVFIFVSLMVNTVKYVISIILLVAFLALSGVSLSWNVLYFFIILFINAVFLFGIMLILAHVGVFLRDMRNMMQYISRTLMYLSPVLFRMEAVPANLVSILYLNPMTTLLVSYRNIFLYDKAPEWGPLGILFLVSIAILYVGLFVIQKYEKQYAKVI